MYDFSEIPADLQDLSPTRKRRLINMRDNYGYYAFGVKDRESVLSQPEQRTRLAELDKWIEGLPQ